MNDERNDETAAPPNGGGADDMVAKLVAENAELKDRALRALAEVENTRRRVERDRDDARQYAVTGFARDMLTIADSFQRALDSIPAEARANLPAQAKAVIEGVEATERQLMSTLERHGVKRIDAAGVKFDPHLHQAIAEVPGSGRPAGTVVDVVQSGYRIADRLLRPAMVTVAARDSTGAANDATPGGQVDTKA